MTPPHLFKSLRWMSWLQGLSLLASLLFLGMHFISQILIQNEDTFSLIHHRYKLQTLVQTQLTYIDEPTLNAIDTTFQSLTPLIATLNPSSHLTDALGMTMDQFTQLENKRAKLQALILEETKTPSQNIENDLRRLINSQNYDKSPPDLYTILSLRYGYNLSRHHLASFSEFLQGSGLKRAKAIIAETLNTLADLAKKQEAGKNFVLVQQLKSNFSHYLEIVEAALSQHEELIQTQDFFKKQTHFFINKLEAYQKSLYPLNNIWMIRGLVMLACAFILFIASHLRLSLVIRRYGLYMKNLTDLLKQVPKKRASLSAVTGQAPSVRPSSTPARIAVAGFSLSNLAKEMHLLIEKTDLLTKTMKTCPTQKGSLPSSLQMADQPTIRGVQ